MAQIPGLAGDSAAYVVPDDEVWVIKQITFYVQDFGVVTQYSMTGLGEQVYFSGSTAVFPQWQTVETRITLEPEGDFFQLHATFATDFHVDGFRLSLP